MKNTFPQYFRKFCDFLGDNNNSLYSALTIAVSKGTLRPMFTMLDKKQEKKSRKYTAFREGTTGAVAIVSYLATDKVVDKFANSLARRANVIEKLPQLKATSKIISVSLTALFIIPYVCNKITSPLMNVLSNTRKNIKIQPQKTVSHTPVFKGINVPSVYKSTINPMPFHYDYGMRIGGGK